MSLNQTLAILDASNPPTDDNHSLESLQVSSSDKAVEAVRTAMPLPWDFLKTPSTPYQPGYQVFTHPAILPLASRYLPNLDSGHPGLFGLAIFLGVLSRYTQQGTIDLDVTFPDATGNSGRTSAISMDLASSVSTPALIDYLATALEKTRSPGAPASIAFTFLFEDKEFLGTMAAHPNLPTAAQSPDLHLYVIQSGSELHGILEYNTCLFRPGTIERMSGHLVHLAEGAIAQPNKPIASIPLLTPAEEQQLTDWESRSFEFPQQPIFTTIESHAAERPTAIALSFKDQHLSYGELNQRANQLAHYLIQIGVRPGVRVATCIEPCIEVLVAVLAIFKAGGTYIPLDPSHPQERLSAILEDTQPPLLLTQSHLVSLLPVIAPSTFCLDRDWETVRSQPTHNPNLPLDLDQIAYVIYTSGTTGKPKGVMVSHRNLLNYIWVAQEKYGFNAHDVMPAMARFSFSICMFELFSPLVAGGRLIILERDHILDFKRLVQTLQEITVIHISPSLMRKLLGYIQEQKVDLQTLQGLRHLSFGGDMVPADLLNQLRTLFPQAELYVIYGCSEISCMGCTYPIPTEPPIIKTRVGKPFTNVSVHLYDPQQNRVPIGIVGEIYFGGAGVTQGYLNRSELNREKFVSIDGQRFYRTGDLGRWHEDGNLEILGRSDFQIQLRGIRMEPSEIEAALRKIEGIHNAVVAAKTRPGHTEKNLVAYIVFEEGQSVENQTIRHTLNQSLPDYMIPTLFVILPELPLNINGKVDRRVLPELDEVWDTRQTRTAPQTPLEKQLVEIWEQYLPVHPIGTNQDFFELGGDSLISVEILTHIDEHLGVALPFSLFMQSCTVSSVATLMSSGAEIKQDTGIVPLRTTGSKLPLFCLYGVLLYRDLVNSLPDDRPAYGIYLNDEVDMLRFSDGSSDELATSRFSSVPTIAAYYIETIQALQPHGPYHLLGESFGGVVAYEMAQQLTAAGEEVAVVALLDSKAPNTKAEKASASARLKKHVQLAMQQGPSYFTQKVTSKIQSKLAKTSAVVGNNADRIDAMRDRLRKNASRSYFVRPYDGSVVLFRAEDRDPFEVYENQDMGWGEFASALTVISVPGCHLGILRHPNVQYLADQLAPYLE